MTGPMPIARTKLGVIEMRYIIAISLVLFSAQTWPLSLEDRLILDLYNKSVSKNQEEAQSLVAMNCKKASARIAKLTLNTSQKGDLSEILNTTGLLLAILKESNSAAYNAARISVLDGDIDSISSMFNFEEQGLECTAGRTLKKVINSAYTP